MSRWNLPDFRLPPLVAAIGSRLPQWPHAVALCGALNVAARMGVLPADSLAVLEGRNFLVAVEDTGTEARFRYGGGLFRPLLGRSMAPDLVFRATLSAYGRLLLRQEDPDTLFFGRQLVVEGDTELGLVVKNMLDAVDWPALPRLPGLSGGRH